MEENNKIYSPVSFDDDLLGKKSISFSVEGEPFAKQRPRAARRGRFITIYTPNETKQYEKKVSDRYKYYYENEFTKDNMLTGALTVKIEGVFAPPKSISNKKREMMLDNKVAHIKKPDCDNMAKICLDALNGVAYPDDALINKLVVTKKYGENARVNITIIEDKEI